MRSFNPLYIVHRHYLSASLRAAALALAVALVAPSPARAGQDIFLYDAGEIRRIPEPSWFVADLEIGDGGQVVWQGWDGVDHEIFLYDGMATDQLSDKLGRDQSPRINAAGQVVWFDSNGKGSEIFFFDGEEVRQITDNDWQDYSPEINSSGQVVWHMLDPADQDWEIVLYDGTGKQALTRNDWDDESPEINASGWIVWQMRDPSEDDWEIVLYDGAGKRALTHNDRDDLHPRINDAGQVVWEQGYRYWSEKEIFLYDGTSVLQLTDNEWGDEDPRINDAGQVVWSGFDGTDYEVFLYDGSEVHQLTDNHWDDRHPRINNAGQVVWSGERDSADGEVFLYDGVQVRQLTDDAFDDQEPRINDAGQVVWVSSGRCHDGDGDGYGYGDDGLVACDRRAADCDDTDPAVNAAAREGREGDPTCADGIDNDCDGLTDGEDGGCSLAEACRDRDGDGFAEPSGPECLFAQRDCDDSDPALNPGVREVCDNGRDDDCDGYPDGEDPECGGDVWEYETIDEELGGGMALALFGEMALDAEDRAHLVYYDEEDRELRYATNATGTWVTTTVQSDADTPLQRGLALDPAGGVYFVYREWVTGMARYCTNTSGAWESFALEGLPAPASVSWAWATDSIAVNDAGVVNALHWEGDWSEEEGPLLFYSGMPGELESEVLEPSASGWAAEVAVGPAGDVHTVYVTPDPEHGGSLLDYMHAVKGRDGWEKEVLLDDFSLSLDIFFIFNVLLALDLAVDGRGGAHLITENVHGGDFYGYEFYFLTEYHADRWGVWARQGSRSRVCTDIPCRLWQTQAVGPEGTATIAHVRPIQSGPDVTVVALEVIEDLSSSQEAKIVHGPIVVDSDLLAHWFWFHTAIDYSYGTLPLALDSRGRPHLCFQDPETGALMYATQRPPAFGLIGPAEGKGLTEPPVLSWQAGDREAFGLLLFLRLAGLGYQPIGFWMERDRFPIPQAWWQAMVPDEPQFWVVLARDAETGTLEASEARWFTKEETAR